LNKIYLITRCHFHPIYLHLISQSCQPITAQNSRDFLGERSNVFIDNFCRLIKLPVKLADFLSYTNDFRRLLIKLADKIDQVWPASQE